MLVGEGDPVHIIDWFKTNSRANWLGFFLNGDVKYNHLLNEVLKHGDIFDNISGFHIDLFLFGVGTKIGLTGEGMDVKLPITPLTSISQGSYPIKVSNIHDVNRSVVGVKQIIKANSAETNGISDTLGLGVDDLASLVLIGKDFDYTTKEPKLILRTRGHADAEFLVEFIRSLRRVLEKQEKVRSLLNNVDPSRSNRSLSVDIDRLQGLLSDAERQTAFLSEKLRSSGLDLGHTSLLKIVLNPQSLEYGLKSAAAEKGIDTVEVERILQTVPAVANVYKQLSKTERTIKLVTYKLESYVNQSESVFSDLERVVSDFDKRISFRIAIEKVRQVFSISTTILTKAKKLVTLVAALKSGGTSLLG